MAFQILSTVTNVLHLDLFDEVNCFIFQSIPHYLSVISSYLPENRFCRILIYGTGLTFCFNVAPVILRNIDFFDYHYRHMAYFHRCCPYVLNKKEELLGELNTDFIHSIPKVNNEKVVILEINAGGGSNLMYYPDNSFLIATDIEEKYKETLLQNFQSELSEDPIVKNLTLDRFVHTCPEELVNIPDKSVSVVVCFHSLCQAKDVFRALHEIKRVLLPKGRFYFIEHVREFEEYSWKWFKQIRFYPEFSLIQCNVGRNTQLAIEQNGFSKVVCNRFYLDLSNVKTIPIVHALAPHIYGYAVN